MIGVCDERSGTRKSIRRTRKSIRLPCVASNHRDYRRLAVRVVGKRGGVPATTYEYTYGEHTNESYCGVGDVNSNTNGDTDANSNTDSVANSDEYAAAYDYSG